MSDNDDEPLNAHQGSSRKHHRTIAQSVSHAVRWCLPVLEWFPQLGKNGSQNDIIGGLVIGVMLVPTSLSWAVLAQIPLQCGLAAALFGSFAYGSFGQCAALSIGPVAEVTTLLISIQGIELAARQSVFQSIGIQVGIVSVILSWLGGGNVIRTIFAKTVADGYTTAAAVLVIITQAKLMFNVPAPTSTSIQAAVISTTVSIYNNFGWKNLYAFLLFLVYTGYLLGIKKVRCPTWVPHQLIVVVVSIFITWKFQLDQTIGLQIVKDLPSGIPPMTAPNFDNFLSLAPYTATVTIVAFLQNYSIARKLLPYIDPDRELFACGMCNLVSCMFGGMPVASSLARSGVLLDRGVKTPLTAFLAGLIMLLTMTVLTRIGVFYYLPLHALTAIIVSGVIKLCDFTEATHLYRVSFMDFGVWVTTFILTLVSGITVGVLTGIALSLVLVILRVARPRVAAVGYQPEKALFTDLRDDPELLVYPNILIWRFDGPLYFVSIGYFEERLKQAVRAEVRNIDVVIVYCSKISDIDAAAVSNLPIIVRGIETMDPLHPRRVLLAQVHGRIEPALQRCPLNKPASRATMKRSASFQGSLNDTTVSVANAFLESQQVFFRSITEAVSFAQRYVEELHALNRSKRLATRGGYPLTDSDESFEPKPHVSFLVDAVMETEKDLVVADSAVGTPVTPSRPRKLFPGAGSAAREDAARRVVQLRKASLFDEGKELIGVVGIVRHAERTPKQKIKLNLPVNAQLQAALAGLPTEDGKVQEGGYALLARLLRDESRAKPDAGIDRCAALVDELPDGLEVKMKLAKDSQQGSVALVFKWGGTLSPGGVVQARQLGKELIARFFAAGDLPLDKMSLFTTNVEAFSPNEERLIQTATVMMKALTGNESFSDIIINDAMLSHLSPATRTLMDRAQQQFSAVMHVRSVAAAVHCLHISGLRELLKLSIPPPLHSDAFPPTMLGEHHALFPPGSIYIERPMRETARAAGQDDVLSEERTTPPSYAAVASSAVTSSAAGSSSSSSSATTPYDVIRRIGELLRIVSAEVIDVSSTDKAAIYLHQHESLAEFLLRWRTHSRTYWRRPAEGTESSSPCRADRSGDEFDLSNVNRLVDDAKYDACHNAEHLHKAAASYFPQLHPVVGGLRELDHLLTALATVATATLRGSNSSERFILGAHTCQLLFAKIEKDIESIMRADMERSVYELLAEAHRLFIASKTNLNVEAVLAVQDKMLVSLRKRITSNLQSPTTDDDGGTSPSSPSMTSANRSRFATQMKDLDLFQLPPYDTSHDDVCTHFYFAPQSHASTAQGCLFDCNSIKGFTRFEGSSESTDVLHYMTHVIFKVFRCRRATLSDTECKDLLLALPLVRTRMMTEGEQSDVLRQGLRDIYRQRYFTSVEVFMSTGAEDCGSRSSCGSNLKPMIRVHPGIRPSQFTALNKEIDALLKTFPA